jgi:hypothetical protein
MDSGIGTNISLFILVTIGIVCLCAVIGVETLCHLQEKGLLDKEWIQYAEYLKYRAVTPKPRKKSLFTMEGVKQTVTSVMNETTCIKSAVMEKMKPKVKKTPITVQDKIIQLLKSNVQIEKDVTAPNMYLRKGYSLQKNPLERLPFILAAPFYVIDTTWDTATDIAAGVISTCVISPIRITRQLIQPVSNPFQRK